MERDEKKLHGPVNGKFRFKQLPNGTVDKSIVICTICSKEFSYHRSSSSLKYHLNAKHLVASSQVRAASDPEAGASSQPRQTTLDQAFKHEMSKSTCDRPTNSLAKWIAMDCRPVSVVEYRDLLETLQMVSSPDARKKG
jgi:hypothetical protein